MWVKFRRPWGRHTTGDVVNVRRQLARFLSRMHYADILWGNDAAPVVEAAVSGPREVR